MDTSLNLATLSEARFDGSVFLIFAAELGFPFPWFPLHFAPHIQKTLEYLPLCGGPLRVGEVFFHQVLHLPGTLESFILEGVVLGGRVVVLSSGVEMTS